MSVHTWRERTLQCAMLLAKAGIPARSTHARKLCALLYFRETREGNFAPATSANAAPVPA